MRGEKVLVVLSGGQDSTTCLFWACKEYGADNVHTITFDYGQRHRIELAAAARVAEMAGIYAGRREVAIIPNILLSTSPLVSGCELEQYTDAGQMEAAIGTRRELTFVPMRNALFLTVAANRAEAFNCSDIVLGHLPNGQRQLRRLPASVLGRSRAVCKHRPGP
jgi:7-cyano-7-deazaguanine synthase